MKNEECRMKKRGHSIRFLAFFFILNSTFFISAK